MRTLVSRTVSLALVSLCLCTPACEEDPTPQLQETFDKLIAARSSGDGETVLTLIDPKNVEHYDSLIASARTAKYTQISGMEPIERMEIAYLRAALKPEELKALDGRKFVILETQSKLEEDAKDRPQVTLVNVKTKPPRATAELAVNDEETDIRVEFVEVDGKWLVNDECFDKLFNRRIKTLAKLFKMSEDSFIMDIVSGSVGRTIHTSIYDALPQ